MGTRYSSNSVAGYNASPPADDGSQTAANQVKWSTIKTKLDDPLNTAIAAINSSLVTFTDFGSRLVTTNDSPAAADHMKTIEISSTVSSAVTISLPDAATVAAGYIVGVKNSSSNSQTVALTTGANTLDGTAAGTATILTGGARMFKVNNAATGYISVSGFSTAAYLTSLTTAAVTSSSALLSATNYIAGLIQANAAGDVTNDITISAGNAADATLANLMSLPSAITKQLDVNWAVGTNAGGLDTGAIGNSDYYLWLIKRVDTNVVDVLFSLSSTAPTMPTNYTLKRLIGWIKRVGAAIVLFTSYEVQGGGLEILWTSPTLDVDLSNTLTTSRRTDAVKVPLNFSVIAHLNAHILDAGLAGPSAWVYCPDQADLAANDTGAPLENLKQQVINQGVHAQLMIRTSAAGLVAARSTLATVDSYQISTMGLTWGRRN